MDKQLSKLEEIAYNTMSISDVEIRLGDVEAKLDTTNELLKDILSALQDR